MIKLPKLLLSILLLVSLKSIAQDKKLDDLNFLYVDGKFDKLVYKATDLTLNNKYKKHPMPYLYCALGYYGVMLDPAKYKAGEKDSDFPKPLKSAQKYLYKYIKLNEKAKKYFPDYESTYDDYKEFYSQIADTSNKLGQNFYLLDKANKAASIYKAAYRAVPSDPVLLLWEGITEIKSKNSVEGEKNVQLALKIIDENYKPNEVTQGVIANGMLILQDYYTQKGDMENANKVKKLVDVFKKYDPDELDKEKMEERKKNAKKNEEIMRKFYSDENDSDNQKLKHKVTVKETDKSKKTDEELDKIEKEATGGN